MYNSKMVRTSHLYIMIEYVQSFICSKKELHLFTCLDQICNERYNADIVKRKNELLISLFFFFFTG